MRAPLQHRQNLILSTHTLLHLLNSLQSNLPTRTSINRLKNITLIYMDVPNAPEPMVLVIS